MVWVLGLVAVVGAAVMYLRRQPPGVYRNESDNPNAVWRRQKPHHG